LIHHE
jgi:quinol monooxygenase YgiN